MRQLFILSCLALASASLFAQGAGRNIVKPGETTNSPSARIQPDDYNHGKDTKRKEYDHTPGGGHLSMTPIALTLGPAGMPYGRYWGICGLRLNLGLPTLSHQYESVYGFDVGLSGEVYGEAGGILVNVFNNSSRDVYGLAVAGLWNSASGVDGVAAQIAPILNHAEGLAGFQIGLVNHAHVMHGVQIGLYNQAVNGGALQIGLWNDQGNGAGTPLIGIVF